MDLNEYIIDGVHTRIRITRRKGNDLFALIDTADLDRVRSFPAKWGVKWNKTAQTFYVRASKHKPSKSRGVFLHRWIMCVFDREIEIDHKNHNGLDNTRVNLKLATRSMNQHNRHGKDRDAEHREWPRYIQYNKKDAYFFVAGTYQKALIYRGSFSSVEEATPAALVLAADIDRWNSEIVVVPQLTMPVPLAETQVSTECVTCGKEFSRSSLRRATVCSRSCHAHLIWKNRQKRLIGVSK